MATPTAVAMPRVARRRRGSPKYVDFHRSEFEFYKRATELGYTPLAT